MSGKGDLLGRGKNAHIVSPVARLIRSDKRRLGKVHLLGNLLHLSIGIVFPIPENRQLISGKLCFRKHIYNIKATF